MDRQKEVLLQRAADTIGQIRSEIYSRMEGKPVSAETLADALQPYFKQKSRDELCHDAALLKKGLEEGEREFEVLNQLSDSQLQDRLAQQLDDCMEGLSDAEKRQYLLTIAQVILQDSGLAIDGKLSIYMANLSLPDLRQRVNDLLQSKGYEAAEGIAELMEVAGEKLAATPAAQTARAADEADWMEAAVSYAALQSSGANVISVIDASDVGRQVGAKRGFLRQTAGKTKEWLQLNARALLVRGLTILAIAAVAFLLWKVLAAFGGATVIWKQILSLLPKTVRPIAFPLLAVTICQGLEQIVSPIWKCYPFRKVRSEMQQRNGLEMQYGMLQQEAQRFSEESGDCDFIEEDDDFESDYGIPDRETEFDDYEIDDEEPGYST